MINDHTDAEYARREHDYEMGETPQDYAWDKWANAVEARLLGLAFTTLKSGLDGDQETDGFSLDFAYDFFRDGATPEEYIEDVLRARREMETAA